MSCADQTDLDESLDYYNNERAHKGKCAVGERPWKCWMMANKSARENTWLELELTITIVKPVAVRSNLTYYM